MNTAKTMNANLPSVEGEGDSGNTLPGFMLSGAQLRPTTETSLIPTEWETDPQLTLDGLDLQNVSSEDREAYCRFLLGKLQSRYRDLKVQGNRVRERIALDGSLGHRAMMDTPAAEDNATARQQATESLTNWFYKDGQNEKETISYIGAVGCSSEAIGAIKELNRQKAGFKQALGHLRDALHHGTQTCGTLYSLVGHIAPNALPNVERRYAGSLVRHLTHTRLNIRQLVRQIPVVGSCPATIRWRWTEVPTTLRLKRADVLEYLDQRADNPLARLDYERICTVSDGFFCWRKGISHDCRISVKCGLKSADTRPHYLSFKSRMPVFYLELRDSGAAVPPKMTVVPDETERRTREKRVDPEPFLNTMAIHRYLNPSAS